MSHNDYEGARKMIQVTDWRRLSGGATHFDLSHYATADLPDDVVAQKLQGAVGPIGVALHDAEDYATLRRMVEGVAGTAEVHKVFLQDDERNVIVYFAVDAVANLEQAREFLRRHRFLS